MNIISILDRPIAFHRVLVEPCGSVNAALFLSQAIYWTNRLPEDRDGWFYKTHKEWTDETGLTRKEQGGARTKLKAANLLEEVLAGNPAQLHFRVIIESLEGMCQKGQLDARKRTTRCAERDNYTIRNKEYTEITISANSKRFVRPSLEQIEEYIQERGLPITEGQRFQDYQDSKGWVVGTAPMKDWKAAIRTWEGNYKKRSPATQKPKHEIESELTRIRLGL